MLSEARSAGTAGAAPRAGIALLTLLLRSALKEAADAEAAADEIARASTRDELRARLAPLLEQRRGDLDASVAHARAEAAGVLSAAHREAAAIVADAAPPIADVTAWLEDTLEHEEVGAPPASASMQAEQHVSHVDSRYTSAMSQRAELAQLALQLRAALHEASDAESAAVVADHAAMRDSSESYDLTQRRVDLDASLAHARAEATAVIVAAHREAATIVAAATRPLPVAVIVPEEPLPARATEPTPITAVVDGEAFAKVFATVFATMLDERLAAGGAGLVARPVDQSTSLLAAPTVAVKQSFWAHARHLDVLLLSAAMVIVLVVLAAWLA